MACRSGGFVDWGSAGIAIGEEMFDEALLLARCWDVACLEACSADLLRNISGQARLLLTPQKTADFGHKESALSGRFRLGSVISTVPE